MIEKRDLDIICNSSVNWKRYQNTTVLITGATGRLGHYILETLVDMDLKYNLNMHIVGLARSQEKVSNVFGDILELPNVVFLYQDINNTISYTGIIDFIFHTAGAAAPIDFRDHAVETLWGHVNGTHNVLECARRHKTKRVLYVSTVEIYGDWQKDCNIKESDMGIMRHLNFRACYPEAKRLCETMLESYKEEYGVDYCGVRLSHTLGPGIALDDGRAFAEFINCALNGQNIVLHSDGSTMRTYTYIADAINAMFLVMEKGESSFYNVAADENLISIKDLAELVASMSHSKAVKVLYSKKASMMPYLPYKLAIMDTTKVRELGWKRHVDIITMFRWTVESFY